MSDTTGMIDRFKVGVPVWGSLVIIGCFVLWAFKAESSLDKRVTVLESGIPHLATKVDLANMKNEIIQVIRQER